MAEKNFNTRIVNKHDTETNWNKVSTFIPKKGELIIYDPDTTNEQARVKIGDGVSTVSALPFVTDIIDIDALISSLKYNGATASGTATQFITQVTQADGVISATKASIPTASGTTLGMVKQGGDVTIASGIITVNDDSHNHIISNVDGLQSALNAKATPAQITSAIQALDYTSPETSGTALEFITTVSQADGVVSATKASIPVASSDNLGLVKSGTDITVDTNGNVSVVNNSHKHTIANVTSLQDTLDAKATPAQISSAISALKATDPTASGTATQFISTISQSDGVITATKASLPTAGTSLGMVKSGGDVTISNGTITVVDDSHNHIISNVDGLQSALDAKATPANITTAINALDYSGATASGNATSFITQVTQADGVVSATKATVPSANSTTLGLVKGGGDVTISDGVISVVDDSHNHVISNVDGLQAALNAKATPANITTAIEALDFAEPTASGTSTTFIATVSQADGVISATKKSIPTANGTTLGMVKGGGDVTISSGVITVSDNSHKHTASNISDLTTTMNSAITTAIGALDASDPAASGTATQFISSISQQDGVIIATKANITAAALGLSGAMRFLGTSATAITDGATTNPITIGSTSTTVTSGNVVLYGSKEFVWNGSSWEELGNEGSYKVQQTAVSSPAASGSTTAFIDTISQNAQGVITATKKNVTFPTLSGGSAAGADATVVGGVTVSGHTVTVGKKTLTAGSNVTITGAADKITIAATDTTYGAASQSAAGLMSAADKKKLDGIAAGANNYTYTLPAATSSTLGGVKIGSNISVSSGTISLSKTNVTNALGYTPPQGNGTGASGTWGISITGNAATATNVAWSGVTSKPSYYDAKAIKSISRSGTTFTATHLDGSTSTFTQQDNNTTYSAATQSAAGLMSAADKQKLDGIAAGANNYTYTLPTASSSTLGGVKIGTGIAISSGVISNSGVRSISTGTANGTISVNTNGTSANVAVKGLGSAAYKDASGTWGISITGSSASCTGNAATASAVAWGNVTGKPSTFTPATHTHNLVDLGDIIVSTTTPTSVTNGKWYLIKQG